MKIRNLKSSMMENKQRGSVALLLFICVIGVVVASVAAQVGSHSRVTGLQLSDTPEGSRVSVVSDAALADYEAFRRGDRFYVKIPAADLATAVPTFRAAGFEDMQVQRQGDSVVVSFKLQPGASARVDQHGNRLDVVFSSPNRTAANTTALGSNRGPAGSQVIKDRGPDGAGPIPPSTAASSSRVGAAAEHPASATENRFPRSELSQASQRGNANKNSNASTNGQANSATASHSPVPGSSPTSILSPGTSPSFPSLGTASPAPSVSSASGTTGASGSFNWRNRFAAAKQWMSANRLASFLAALILLSLIAYLVLAIRGRKEGYKAKSAKTPKVQPKYSAGEELREVSQTKPAANETTVPQKSVAQSAAAAATPIQARVLTKPSIVSTPVSQEEITSEQEEREVFEL
jgi:hypothetical protein